MTVIQAAKGLIADLEVALRNKMKEALDQQRYAEVAQIAALTEALAALLRPDRQPQGEPLADATGTSAAAAVARVITGRADGRVANLTPLPTAPTRRGKAARDTRKYPRFVREADRLVKIGWSKKHRGEYEHRVPRAIVLAATSHLASSIKPGRLFTMEELLPFRDAEGQEIPAYQSYLVLKWLQHLGAIKKKGKDGYIAQGAALNHDRIVAAWDALRES